MSVTSYNIREIIIGETRRNTLIVLEEDSTRNEFIIYPGTLCRAAGWSGR
jgi:hypothetical protein